MIDPALLQNLAGIPVRLNPLITTERPVRQHKKRRNQSANYHARVQKKWTKRFGKKRVPSAVLFNERVLGGTRPVLYAHPDFVEKLKCAICAVSKKTTSKPAYTKTLSL